MRVILSAELVGGDELEEYYCPSVIWRWGRTGSSRSTSDCAPYDPETSTIRRRYTVEHMFRSAGRYRVYFLLSNRGHDLGAAFVDIVVQP